MRGPGGGDRGARAGGRARPAGGSGCGRPGRGRRAAAAGAGAGGRRQEGARELPSPCGGRCGVAHQGLIRDPPASADPWPRYRCARRTASAALPLEACGVCRIPAWVPAARCILMLCLAVGPAGGRGALHACTLFAQPYHACTSPCVPGGSAKADDRCLPIIAAGSGELDSDALPAESSALHSEMTSRPSQKARPAS